MALGERRVYCRKGGVGREKYKTAQQVGSYSSLLLRFRGVFAGLPPSARVVPKADFAADMSNGVGDRDGWSDERTETR